MKTLMANFDLQKQCCELIVYSSPSMSTAMMQYYDYKQLFLVSSLPIRIVDMSLGMTNKLDRQRPNIPMMRMSLLGIPSSKQTLALCTYRLRIMMHLCDSCKQTYEINVEISNFEEMVDSE